RPGMAEIVLPEGRYQARVSGAVTQQVDFRIESGFFDRWFRKPVHVLNPGGSAILVWEETLYSSKDDSAGAGENFRLFYGEPFVSWPHVDYDFAQFPKAISSKTGRETKSRVDLVRAPVEDVFFSLARGSRLEDAMRLGEWHLR